MGRPVKKLVAGLALDYLLGEPHFVDLAPAEIYATLLDRGIYSSPRIPTKSGRGTLQN